MKIFTEKEAENFLKKKGFKVLNGVFVKKEDDLEKASKKIGFPCVAKISGKKIVHKHGLGGVKVGINNYEELLDVFKKFKKIKGCEEVLIQDQVSGKEFLLGIKYTPEFSHVLAFGTGGTGTEEIGDVSFRACPASKNDIREMIKETKISQGLLKKDGLVLEKNLLKLCKLSRKFPKIKELDINPLIGGKIVDARIVFDD